MSEPPDRSNGGPGGRPEPAGRAEPPGVPGTPRFSVQLGLGRLPATVTEVRAELGSQLDAFEPQLERRGPELALTLTVVAGDVWSAVLLAMAVATEAGYPATQLDARPYGSRSDGR